MKIKENKNKINPIIRITLRSLYNTLKTKTIILTIKGTIISPNKISNIKQRKINISLYLSHYKDNIFFLYIQIKS